jgi:putative hydrolase of the HAD superfamily
MFLTVKLRDIIWAKHDETKRGSDLHQIRAITLDLDDTLWAIEPVIRRAEEKLWLHLADNYPRIASQFSAEDVHAVREDVMEEYPDFWHDFRFLRKKVLEKIAHAAGYNAELVEPAFGVFDRARNDVELFPDVLPHLESLSEEFALIALTNGNANLDEIGIGHLFQHVVAASDVGFAKPARPIFDAAIACSGLAGDEILHVGDHPETDIDGARRAGMRTAWMNRIKAAWPSHLAPPDAVVTSLTELSELLQPARSRMGEGR